MSYFLQHSDFVTVMVRSIQSTSHFVMYFTRQKYPVQDEGQTKATVNNC